MKYIGVYLLSLTCLLVLCSASGGAHEPIQSFFPRRGGSKRLGYKHGSGGHGGDGNGERGHNGGGHVGVSQASNDEGHGKSSHDTASGLNLEMFAVLIPVLMAARSIIL